MIKTARYARRGPALAPASGLGEAPAGARRPTEYPSLIWRLIRSRNQYCAVPSSSAFQYPTPGRRVEVAPSGRVACDRLRRTSTRRPLARARQLSGRQQGLSKQELQELRVQELD